MKRITFLTILITLFLVPCFAQEKVKPRILCQGHSETVRDGRLERAIREAAEFGSGEEERMRYYYNRVDLNNDKKPEVIVFLFGEGMCGSSGCDAFLFQKIDGKYKLITAFEPVRNPIIVSQTKTKGWNDLIFYNAGGGIIPGYYSLSRFNGKTYPANPTVEKDSPSLKTRIKGKAYVVGEYSSEFGLRFP
jgi:hypothetical protein